MGRRETAEQQDRLLQELNRERAAALVRISGVLESLITELEALRGRLADPHHERRRADLAAYRALRARALEYRWYLEVQREALGLRQHHRLDEFYRIPEAL